MIDGHVHLEKGPHTKEYVYEFIEEAIKKGIDELQILDHTHRFKEFLPIYDDCRVNKPQIDWFERDFKDSIYSYINLIEEIKKEDLPIKVRFGLEVCYQESQEENIRKLVKGAYDWDFLVGSVHFVNNITYDCPWSKDELWNKYNVDDIYKRYYEMLINLVKSDLFTQLGHPDTIKMFNYYPSYDLTDTYNKLAEELNKHHVRPENNTGCYYRYNHKDMGLSDELLSIFKKHNCNLITASDAHYPKDVGSYIKEVWDKTMY